MIAAVTMVQASDCPHAFTSLSTIKTIEDPNIFRLVLLNGPRDDKFADMLGKAIDGDVIQAERNLGVAGGRNRLINEAVARGAKFILSIDDDILVPTDFAQTLRNAYDIMQTNNHAPGLLTPATLDFHQIGEILFDADDLEKIANGHPVNVPATEILRQHLTDKTQLRTRDIYHMGIRDWRGAYLFTGSDQDCALRQIYGVRQSKYEGAMADWRYTKKGINAIQLGSQPLPIDTAPGGICFYSADLVAKIGLHDETYNPFGYEDADFALRARASGYNNFCIPRAIAVHDIAARLNQRPTSVLRSTQGKMAGSFARKHLSGKEAAAAFFAISSRVANNITLRAHTKREHNIEVVSFTRLSDFATYIGNAILYLLPGNKSTNESQGKELLDAFQSLIAAITPVNVQLSIERVGNSLTIRPKGSDTGTCIFANIDSPTAGQDCLSFAMENIAVEKNLLPEFFRHIANEQTLNFNCFGVFKTNGVNTYEIVRLEINVDNAFHGCAAGSFRRDRSTADCIEPLIAQSVNLNVIDNGALARVLLLLSKIENKSPAAFIDNLSKMNLPAPLTLFLTGATSSINIGISGELDGAPGPLKIKVDECSNLDAAQNYSVYQLASDFRTPSELPDNHDKPIGGGQLLETIKKITTIPRRLLAEDPSVAPYPEAYNPSTATKFVRKLRYVSAGRNIPLWKNEARLLSFKNKHVGARAFIIGNGPSLNKIDLGKLKNEITFGVNAIYLNQEKMGFLPTHHIVEDVYVAEDRASEINELSGPVQWFGNYLRYCLDSKPNVCWLNTACDYRNYPNFPYFSTNAARIIWVGGTVSYIAMQIAYYMGFKEVYLVGFDHSYSVPKDAAVDGRAILSNSDDPNHFHPDYFGKGYRWHDPRVDRMEQAYFRAREAYENAGRKIFNATAGGHLEVFDRVTFNNIV